MAPLKRVYAAVCLSAMFAGTAARATSAPSHPSLNISEVLTKYVVSADSHNTTNKLLGAAAIVVDKHGIRYAGSAGLNDLTPDASPFTIDTFGWIASMTKLIATTAAMQMVEDDRIRLDQDLRKLVSELNTLKVLRGSDSDGIPIVENNTLPVTLRQLLSHTLGMGYDFFPIPDLTRYNAYIGRNWEELSFTKEGFLPALIHAPGEGWAYGPSVDWAGALISKLSRKPLDVYLGKRIFKSLGMKSTAFFPDVPPAAVGHETVILGRNPEDGSLVHTPSMTPPVQEFLSAGAGVASTARDYATFLRALLAGKLVSKATLDEMFRPQLNEAQKESLANFTQYDPNGFLMDFPEGTKLSHGLGGVINLEDVPGKRRAGSLAWSGVSNPRWCIDRKSGVAFVMFVNLLPWGDHVVADLWDELETAIYKTL